MVRNILILVFVGCLGYLGYYEYKQHQEVAKLDSGGFTCQGCDSPEEHARFLKENSGESADGNSERKTASARVAAEEATTTSPVTGTSSMVAPTPSAYDGATAANQPPVIVPTTGQPDATPAGIPPAVAAGLPVADSVPANPSNGARFAGSGSYQWYRQGNLTWRVDTTTGRSCIVYATMEEWRKQIVMSHGCGKDA
jgi:hypothetical protein